MITLASTAIFVIATDIVGDAEIAKGILNEEFDHVFSSTEPGQTAVDFVRYQPDILCWRLTHWKNQATM